MVPLLKAQSMSGALLDPMSRLIARRKTCSANHSTFVRFGWAVAGVLLMQGLAHAQNLPMYGFMAYVPSSTQSTHLIGIQYGSALSRQVGGVRGQSYELSGGELVRFDRWYGTRWQDMQLTWLTELNPRLGVIWGFGTGERGPKYRIAPSMQLGFLYQQPLSKLSAWSVRATTRLGGRLREKTCIADYGDIGGVQAVNCRLAASELQPKETLKYLLDESPRDRWVLAVRYVKRF